MVKITIAVDQSIRDRIDAYNRRKSVKISVSRICEKALNVVLNRLEKED